MPLLWAPPPAWCWLCKPWDGAVVLVGGSTPPASASEPQPFASAAASVYTVSPEGKNPAEGRRKVEVIDLTLDSSSDEEEPPAKKQRPASGGALPAAPGPKG